MRSEEFRQGTVGGSSADDDEVEMDSGTTGRWTNGSNLLQVERAKTAINFTK